MADSSVRARLVARRLGESALYADRVAHKLRARGSATKVERDDKFCNMEMFSKIWGLQSKVGQVYLFLSNKGADSQRKRETAQRVPNPTRPPVRRSMRRDLSIIILSILFGTFVPCAICTHILICTDVLSYLDALSRVSCCCIIVLSYFYHCTFLHSIAR